MPNVDDTNSLPVEEIEPVITEGTILIDDTNEVQLELDQTEIVETLTTNNDELVETLTTLSEENSEIVKSLETINQNTSPSQIDYSESIQEMIQTQNTLIEQLQLITDNLDTFAVASSSIIGYATVYVPLIFVVMCLWWFFKQFIR